MPESATPSKPGPTPSAHLSPQEMSSDQLRQWELTGEAPAREPNDQPADTTADATSKADQNTPEAAAGAKPEEQAASKPDASSEAVPGTAKPERKKAPGQKLSAEERAKALDVENAQLQEKLRLRKALREELRAYDLPAKGTDEKSGAKPAADTSTAKVGADPAWKKYQAMPDAPKMDEKNPDGTFKYATLEEFSAATAHFIAEKIAAERFDQLYDERAGKERATVDRDREFVEMAEEALARTDAEIAADPEILDRIPDVWKGLNPSERLAPGEKLTRAHFVKDQVVFHSDRPLALSELLCANDFAELNRICVLKPAQIIRELAKLETTLDPLDSRETARADKPASTVSKAPPPATALGRKAAPGVDPLQKAIRDGDYLAFERLENERIAKGASR